MPYQYYALLSLKGSFRASHALELTLLLDNLTDTRYQIQRGYPMPGFRALGGLKWRM